MKYGISTVSKALASRSGAAPTQAADRWILRNKVFFFALPLERIADSVLPGTSA